MTKVKIATGVVHEMPDDLYKALTADESALERWDDLTPLARNEWICWTVTCKKPETRAQHVDRTVVDLLKGKRRPCCWAGCPHRPDRVVKTYTKGYSDKNKVDTTENEDKLKHAHACNVAVKIYY